MPFVHLKPIPKDGDSYEVRVFLDTPEDPLGPIDEETGQPWKQWAAGCNVRVKDGVATITLIRDVPPGGFQAVRRALREQLGVTEVQGERWKKRVKREVVGRV